MIGNGITNHIDASLIARIRETIHVQVTADESKNGWDNESLATYLAEREAQQMSHAMSMKPTRQVVVENVKSFDPLGWQ